MDVLVIDDDEHVRTFVKRALERAGHQVHLACDGRRVRELLLTCKPDVVLTDVSMPEVDGFEALAILRQADPSVAVVVMSGAGADHNYLRMAKMLGAGAVLKKPISARPLLEALCAAVERRTCRTDQMDARRKSSA